jgi:hypothetical protein
MPTARVETSENGCAEGVATHANRWADTSTAQANNNINANKYFFMKSIVTPHSGVG